MQLEFLVAFPVFVKSALRVLGPCSVAGSGQYPSLCKLGPPGDAALLELGPRGAPGWSADPNLHELVVAELLAPGLAGIAVSREYVAY